MIFLILKLFLNLVDFEEVRYTFNDTQNKLYWAQNAFAVFFL